MRPYAAYRSSGIPWLGQVPAHWEVKKVKHVVQHTTGWTPPTGNASAYEGDNLWANIGDLGARVISETQNRISDEAARLAGIIPSPAGSLLFSFKLSVGQVSIAGVPLYTNEAIATFLPTDEYAIGWAFYAFPVFIPENSAVNIYGARLLNQQRINDAVTVVPPIHEQSAIAAYLDRETARIDMLISEKEGLIDTLREYRHATISEVVTKGLNNASPKKSSGVPWLGDVPTHWSIEKLKFFVRFVGGGTPSKANEEYWNGDIPWVSPKDMKLPRIDDTEDKITEAALESSACSIIAPGAILVVVRSGILQHTIPIAINDVPVAVNQDMKALLPDEKVLSRFLAYQMLGCQRELREEWVKQGATVESIEQQRMADSRFAIPPLDEQDAIASYLDSETGRIDKLIEHVQDEIRLLQELRAATITDAVTGKIKVS